MAVAKYHKPFVVLMGVEEFAQVMALAKPTSAPMAAKSGAKMKSIEFCTRRQLGESTSARIRLIGNPQTFAYCRDLQGIHS